MTAGQKFIVYSVIAPKLGGKLSVSTKTVANLELWTVVKYSKPVGAAEVSKMESNMNDLTKADYDRLIAKDMKVLKGEHLNAWHDVSSFIEAHSTPSVNLQMTN